MNAKDDWQGMGVANVSDTITDADAQELRDQQIKDIATEQATQTAAIATSHAWVVAAEATMAVCELVRKCETPEQLRQLLDTFAPSDG